MMDKQLGKIEHLRESSALNSDNREELRDRTDPPGWLKQHLFYVLKGKSIYLRLSL